MATRKRSEPPALEIRQFSPEDLERGIAKLRRRIEELRLLETASVEHDDARVEVATHNVRAAVLEVFGENSPQYRAHEHLRLWSGPMRMGMNRDALNRGVRQGIVDTVVILEGLVGSLTEQQGEHAADPAQAIRQVFRGIPLQARIADACSETFLSGHAREAVLNGSIALVNFVKERSGRHDIDGANLMRTVFSRNNPRLAFNDLLSATDGDEQEGMMHLFEGAVMALRNPRAHDVVPDDPSEALEYISFLSLLAKRLERATKRSAP